VIDPIAFKIGPLAIHWYGIIIASAVLVAGVLGTAEAKRRREDPEVGWSMLMWALIGGVAGARIYHVIHQWDFYSAHPDLIPQLWNGGLGIPGVIIGGVLAIAIYCRVKGLPAWRWLDIFAVSTLLGQVIGRLGNFVNQELYGPPTDLPWGLTIDAAHRVGPWTDLLAYPVETARFHPLFAYEALLNLMGVVVLLWIARRFAARLFDGDILLLYLAWYGAVRTALESFRVENWVVGGLPTAVWLGIAAVVGGLGFFLLRHARGWGVPGAWMHREPPPEPTLDAPPADTPPPADAPAEPSPG